MLDNWRVPKGLAEGNWKVGLFMRDVSLKQPFDVSAYHKPKVAVVVTHWNYSEFLLDALRSLQTQTYQNFECVVVDDASDRQEQQAANEIVLSLQDSRFRFIRNDLNIGQTRTFFEGLRYTTAAFCCLLDPDDRYAPNFLARMVESHTLPSLFAPIVVCDQFLFKPDDGIITGTYLSHGLDILMGNRQVSETKAAFGFDAFYPPTMPGWLWTTSSSLMFRRAAVEIIRPPDGMPCRYAADTYLCYGCHMMGGTIFIAEPLVYRGVHHKNAFINRDMFSLFQKKNHPNAKSAADECKRNAVESFFANHGLDYFESSGIAAILEAHFDSNQMCLLRKTAPAVDEFLSARA